MFRNLMLKILMSLAKVSGLIYGLNQMIFIFKKSFIKIMLFLTISKDAKIIFHTIKLIALFFFFTCNFHQLIYRHFSKFKIRLWQLFVFVKKFI